MSALVGLVREFPLGSFLVLVIAGEIVVESIRAWRSRS